MKIKLHANARTTPAIRAYIQRSNKSINALAKELGLSVATVHKWKHRKDTSDRSHTRHNLHASTSEIEERIIYELRTEVGLSLDDLLEVMHRCVNPRLSRSALYRCLKRLGLARQSQAAPETQCVQKFEETTCGFIHMDVKHLPRLKGQKHFVYAAIDRASRYVYVEILDHLNAQTAQGFVRRFVDHFPHTVHTILTDNGGEWTDRFSDSKKGKTPGKPSGKHVVDLVCQEFGIQHKLARPYRPQTNGMIERFNRRLNEQIKTLPRPKRTNSRASRFESRQQRDRFILNFVDNYNHTRLKCLNYTAPLQIIRNHTKEYTTGRGLG